MLLKIFKTSQPLSWILIVFLLVLIRIVLFYLHPIPQLQTIDNSFLENRIIRFSEAFPWISHLLSTIIVLFSGFYFNRISQENSVLKGIHYILILFTGIFMSFHPIGLVVSPMIIIVPILLFSYDIILRQSRGPLSFSEIFNGAFFIGLSHLLFFPSFLLILVMIVALIQINPLNWRHFVIALIGFLTPIFFYDALLFTFFPSKILFTQNWMTHFSFPHTASLLSHFTHLGILILIGLQITTYIKSSSRTIAKIRKTHSINLVYLGFCMVIPLFLPSYLSLLIGIASLPLALFFSLFHIETQKWWWSDLTFLALVALWVSNYLGT